MLAYEAPGFGVGELWLDGGRLVWHELPRPSPRSGRVPRGGRPHATHRAERTAGARVVREMGRNGDESLSERMRAFFRGEAVGFDDVEVGLDWATPFQARGYEDPAAGSARRGRHLRRARRSHRLPERPAGGRDVLRREPIWRRRPVPPRRRGDRARLVWLARRGLQATAAGAGRRRASVSLSEDVRGELVALDPRRPAAVSQNSPRSSGRRAASTSAAPGACPFTSRSRVRPSPAEPSPSSAATASRARSALSDDRPSSVRPATSSTCPRTLACCRHCTRPGSWGRASHPSTGRRGASFGGLAAAPPTSVVHSSHPGL